MKKQILRLCILFLAAFGLQTAQAQDTIRSLIFTEWRGAALRDAYFELTNVGMTELDLSKFTVGNINSGSVTFQQDGDEIKIDLAPRFKKRLSGTLGPGESLVFMNVADRILESGIPMHRVQLIPHADIRVHIEDIYPGKIYYKPEWEMWGKDSVDVYDFLIRHNSGVHGSVLFYHLPGGDSIMIDQVKLNFGSTPMKTDPIPTDVAGVADATFTRTLVRKANIKVGNTDWDDARGVDITDSEWLPIPHFTGYEVYTTVGTHGDYGISMTSATIDFNEEAGTMTVPWGVRKGDSITHEINFGPGMAWLYVEDSTSFEDSAHTIVQDGDILNIYACGNDLEEIDFKITVAEPASDMAMVFPLKRMLPPVVLHAPDYDGPIWGSAPYYVTDEDPVIDTIGNVPFALRVDSLFRYLEKAPNARWEISWVDGIERVDLKYGDILKVTAENGTTVKEYFIDVQEYEASDNAYLAAITWPDKSEFLEGWMGDTVPLFSPTKTSYSITLPYGSTSVPALVALPQNQNAKVTVKPAVSLKGSLTERTTLFVVMAEDDSTSMEYKVMFEVEKDWERVQKFYGQPFFSELATNIGSWIGFVEVMNPGNVPLDLSEYLFVRSSGINPGEALTSLQLTAVETNFKFRYRSYVPGYKYYDDTASWLTNVGILRSDPDVNPVVEPGDVFVLCSASNGRGDRYLSNIVTSMDVIDKLWNASVGTIDPIGVGVNESFAQIKRTANSMLIFKILNDSVLEGTKPVGDLDDYKLVEAFGDLNLNSDWVIAGTTISQSKTSNIARKSYIYKGVTEVGEGIGTTPDSSDWIVTLYPEDVSNAFDLGKDMGGHVMDVVTAYMSTISSTDYLVSDGYLSPQTIQGDLSSTSIEQFLAKISKADTGQILTLISGVDGFEKLPGASIGGDDTLKVVSADSMNETSYVLINLPLDSDATLVAASTSSNLTIKIEGSTGTIEGVSYGDLLKNLVDSVVVPEKAIIQIMNQNGELIPLRIMNYDTVYVDTRIGDSVYFQVVAQDGVTKITYKLEPSVLASDAFVISNVYNVDQATKIISGAADATAVAMLWRNIELARGASGTLIDKYGFERSMGMVSCDDRIRIVSEDGTSTVIYYLQFLGQPEPAINTAPSVTLAQSSFDIKITSPTINVSATVTDDGLPLPSLVSYLWKVIEGDETKVAIASADAMASDVTFAATGNYKLQFTADDGELATMAEVTVTVASPDNTAPVADVEFTDSTIAINSTLKVIATATDDGYPDPPAALTYSWTVKTGDASKVTIAAADQLQTDVTISATGTYVLEFLANDSELIANKQVTLTVTPGVGMEDVLSPAVRIYPNPARDRMTLELNSLDRGTATVRIFNLTGRMVYENRFKGSTAELDLSSLESGAYYLTVKVDNQVLTRKFQILK